MTADQILAALRAKHPTVTGVSIGDLADPQTWRLDGDLTDADKTAAVATLGGLTQAAPSVASFWPTETEIDRAIASLKTRVGKIEQGAGT